MKVHLEKQRSMFIILWKSNPLSKKKMTIFRKKDGDKYFLLGD